MRYLFQPFTHYRANDRCATQAATDDHLKTHHALVIAYQIQADIVIVNCRAIFRRAAHRDFEFPRQEGEFGAS